MKLRPGREVKTYVVFLSSGDDLAELRNGVAKLINEVISPELLEHGTGVQLSVSRWEYTPAQRATGVRLNEDFVRLALDSHLTMVLIRDELRPGTEEEFKAVITEGGPNRPELSVFWFEPTNRIQPKEETRIQNLLDRYRDKIRYVGHPPLGKPSEATSWMEIFRTLIHLAFTAIGDDNRAQGVRSEERPV